MSIQIRGLCFLCFLNGNRSQTAAVRQPENVKLIILNMAEGSSAGPSMIKPNVNSAVTSTVAVSNAVYIKPVFLFFTAETPAAKADKKVINELAYPRLCSLHPISLSTTVAISSKSKELISQVNNAASKKDES